MREAWAEEAHRRLAAAGHRVGGARQDVIEVLARTGGCVTAKELVERLAEEDLRAATASVYRALATLRDLGLLRAFDHGEGVLRYELEEPDGQHHHHMVCEACGTTEAFADERLERAIGQAAAEQDYAVTAHDVVLFGRCRACAR